MSERVYSTAPNAPSYSFRNGRAEGVLTLSGDWTALSLAGVAEEFEAAVAARSSGLAVDMGPVTRLDTGGALVIHHILAGKKPSYRYGDEKHSRLMRLAAKADISGAALPEKPPGVIRLISDVGEAVIEESKIACRMVSFLGEYLVSCFRIVKAPRQLPVTALVFHMEQVGVAAVPIVALLAFLIGMVIAYMGGQQLAVFGLEIFVIKLVEITTLRELGVLITSIVIAGRSGASFTAQIGAMVANEEVAAMRTMGLSPIQRLAFPRITGLLFMLPALVFLADVMGLLGGGVAIWMTLDIGPSAYAAYMRDAINISNFYVGLVKAPFFAVAIGVIGCYQGFQVTGNAESVGRLTTRSVVEAIFMVIVLDALFAVFFTGIKV